MRSRAVVRDVHHERIVVRHDDDARARGRRVTIDSIRRDSSRRLGFVRPRIRWNRIASSSRRAGSMAEIRRVGVDASNREEDERNAVVGTCRVCLEDISREDVEMGKVVSLGCACVSSGRVHDTAECRDAYVAARRAAGERACEICLRPLSAAFISLDRSKRALVVDIDAIDRSGRARVRDARRGVARDRSLDAAESGCFARARARAVRARLRVRRVRVRATRERFCARAHRSRRARVRESRSTDVTRVDGERRASPAVRLADFAPEGNDGARPHSRRHSSTTTSPAS